MVTYGIPAIERLAEFVMGAWMIATYVLFVFTFYNIPILTLFVFHRVSQLRDPRFDLRVTSPTHTGLHLFCALVYGLIYPAFYFLSVRTRSQLGEWTVGVGTNRPWTIAIGAICMTWLAAHLVDAALRLGPPRFGRGWIDRTVAGAALFLCLRFQYKALMAGVDGWYQGRKVMDLDPYEYPVGSWFIGVAYPQLCFAASTLVYGLAFCESLRSRQPEPRRRHWRVAIPVAAVAMALLFLPFWLSIPRVPHEQAVQLLESHREQIIETARLSDLDPALIAGIIYVAHTRDQPRFTGAIFEEVASGGWQIHSFGMFFSPDPGPPPNPSMGLCQIRPSTALQTLHHPRLWNELPAVKALKNTNPISFGFSPASPPRHLTLKGAIFEDPSYYNPQYNWALLYRLSDAVQSNSIALLLMDPENNLAVAALMLSLLKDHWRHRGFPISDRPDILATLYNLGYEKSNPHANPKANDFGRRVAKFMQSEECRRIFGAGDGEGLDHVDPVDKMDEMDGVDEVDQGNAGHKEADPEENATNDTR